MKVKKGQLFLDQDNTVWTLEQVSKTFTFLGGGKSRVEFTLSSEEDDQTIEVPSQVFLKEYKNIVCPKRIEDIISLNGLLEMDLEVNDLN